VWSLESSLLPVVIGMEANGLHVQRNKLRSIADEALKLAQKAADDLRAALGNPGINPASPGQLLAALRAKGLKLESTAEDVLKAADDGHLVCRALNSYTKQQFRVGVVHAPPDSHPLA
jgi:DNA polymerase I-like protein with 3'-5' exonuclease and polymerase domains